MRNKITIIAILLVTILQAQNFTGTWNTTFGDVKLVHEGQIVYGDYGTKGILDAIQTGSTINGKFTNAGRVGEFYFKLASDNKSFTGEWRWQGETTNRGNWTGTLKSDALPSLKMDKWTGQYEFKTYPNGFTKKLNLLQKGFSLEGKFEDRKSFIGKLSNDLKTISNASLYHGNTLYNITTGTIKSENSEHITVWYGDVKASNATTTTKFSAKFLKPMTVAEFKSLTGVNSTSAANYTATTVGLTTTSKGLNDSGNTTTTIEPKKTEILRKDIIIYPKPINPVTEIPGTYRVTLTNIYFPKYVFDGLEGDEIEVYGTAGIRAYTQNQSSKVEIKAKNNMQPRVLDVSEANTSKVKKETIKVYKTRIHNNGKWSDAFIDTDKKWVYKSFLHKEYEFYGKLVIDRSREFIVEGALANKKLEFNIQAQINEEDGPLDDKYSWQQVSIAVSEVDLELEYLLKLPHSKGNENNSWLKDCYIGFKIEKY
jgi:hypothetical protein